MYELFQLFRKPWDEMSWLERAFLIKRLKGGGWISDYETEPYHYRPCPDLGHPYTKERDTIVGASVAWNQLAQADSTHTTNTVTVTKNNDGSVTLDGTASASGTLASHASFRTVIGHVYLMYANADYFSNGHTLYTNIGGSASLSANTIRKETASASHAVTARANTSEAFDNQKLWLNVIDLTLALGSTIADYIYTLESGTAGAGVAWLRKYFPCLDSYNQFDSGSIQSVSGLVSHDMVGVNQWDEETFDGYIDSSNGNVVASANHICSKNFIKCFPNTQYYLLCTNASMAFDYYDADKNIISNTYNAKRATFTTPSNCHYMKWWNSKSNYGSQTYQHDICINLSDASINGQYFPYEKHSYELDPSVTLRGKFNLVDGKLVADGDVYPPSGEGSVYYDEVDLSTLAWTATSTPTADTSTCYYATISDMKTDTSNEGMISEKYILASGKYINQMTDGTMIRGGGKIYVATTQNSVSGKLVYPLQTPTAFSATPYDNPQWCDSSGTEEYVTHGVNCWDEEWEVGGYNPSTGEKTTLTTRIRSKNSIKIIPSTTYSVAIPSAIRFVFFDGSGAVVSDEIVTPSSGFGTFTTPSNAKTMVFYTANDTYGDTYNNDISVNYPSTDTDYHPYGRSIVPVGHNTKYAQ